MIGSSGFSVRALLSNPRGGDESRLSMVEAAQIAPASGLRDSRLPPSSQIRKDREVLKDIWTPPKTIHQNGISSSVIVLVAAPAAVLAGAAASVEAGRRGPPPSPALPSMTMSLARISVVLRLLPSWSSHSRV